MMLNNPLVSLCLPTNGVIEWVFPVLNSIYRQGVDNAIFEVVITDNGNNKKFKDLMNDYLKDHPNIRYFETNALQFLNEIEAYKRANGVLIKYVNHRTQLIDGTLEKIVTFAKENATEKPIIYYTNGQLPIKKIAYTYQSFDEFVLGLSYYSTWSTGMTIWKEDLERILSNNNNVFNELYPHTDILFFDRNRSKYIINNEYIFDEMPQRKIAKGHYDFFYAFGVEYPCIILKLFEEGAITLDTFNRVVDENLSFIADHYINYNILRKYCSYDITGINSIFKVFYTRERLFFRIIRRFFERTIIKIMTLGSRKRTNAL